MPATYEVAWGPLDLSPDRITWIREALESPVASRPVDMINEVPGSYTQEALDAKVEGVVVVSFDVMDGVPVNLHVEQGLGKGLDEKALETVSQFRVKPILVNGERSPMKWKLGVNFILDQRAGFVRDK